ncbi:MAG: class I SAM-dependent methyltransferase [Planctomycetaceae bacterium]
MSVTSVDSVPVEALHTRFGFSEPIEFPAASRHKAFADWKMEVDDAPIFRYLYRNFNPRRHLEFGTWQGFGTVCCLQECGATVWTINLPFGQEFNDGNPGYGNDIDQAAEMQAWAERLGIPNDVQCYQSDRLGFIGRLYLQEDLGSRVCQIYCDSQEWDIANFPSDFFDSVLIDGGHQPEVVLSDTRKALRVLRPGGLILWHDFCLDRAVRTEFPWVEQLVTAIEGNLSWLRPQLKDLFWVDPSWMLIGVKSGHRGRLTNYLRRLRDAVLSRPT